MDRLARELVLAGIFLAVLPVVGNEMSAGNYVPVATGEGGTSVVHKTSAWPKVVTDGTAIRIVGKQNLSAG